MKISLFLVSLLTLCLLGDPASAQSQSQAGQDTTALGLPGDNLDLYAVLDLFQKSKTIEDFEKALNEEKTGINNLDLNLDGKVDFIKVVTKKDGDNFTFILQDDVTKTETQDVAVILVSKDKNKKVTMQIIGDKDLYGEGYIVEPKTKTPAATPNPAYTGSDALTAPVPASTTTVVVEQTPIVQYVYSPVYVPYVPPYYYGFYPPYFMAFSVMAFSMYHAACWGYHGGYGYHGNTTVVVNHNTYNNYNSTRNTSNTVKNNRNQGNYSGKNGSTRPGGGGSGTKDLSRPSTSDRQAKPSTSDRQPGNRQSNPSVSDRQSGNKQSGNRQSSPSVSDRQSGYKQQGNRQSNPSVSDRQTGNRQGGNRESGSMSNRQSSPSRSSSYGGGGGNRGGGSSYSGGRSGGGYSGGGGRSGGGGGRGGGGRGGRR